MKTFIRWPGNKSKHINKILPYIPDFKGIYIEPFVGSGAMLLKIQPSKWIINDLNKDLINVCHQVKENPREIINTIKKFGRYFKQLSNDKKIKYCSKITESIDSLEYNLERATKFMLMKYCAYMGFILVKNKFFFAGLDLNITINNRYFFLEDPTYKNLLECSKFLNKASSGINEIHNKDYKKILRKSKKGDFVFLDPPYIEENNYRFNYNKNEIVNNGFIDELLDEMKKLDLKGVKWLMTQAESPYIRKIFINYTIKTFEVYRACSKSYKTELIIMNY